MHLSIDADGSPRGYLAWYNHFTQSNLIRSIRPAIKNGRFGVQRMEMLAIYFAIADNIAAFQGRMKKKRTDKKVSVAKRIVVIIRSDSKSTIEQLRGICEIRDEMLLRICEMIQRLLRIISCSIAFKYVQRTNNMAGLLLEQNVRMKKEVNETTASQLLQILL
jgi:hypothetical protein